MILNKEDFAILQEDVRQIENYLRSLMPEIVESFSVGFGLSYMPETQYMPVLFKLEDVTRRLEPLAAYQAETGEYGANVENPFYSVQVPKNKED